MCLGLLTTWRVSAVDPTDGTELNLDRWLTLITDDAKMTSTYMIFIIVCH
jgi:hypothetical protein